MKEEELTGCSGGFDDESGIGTEFVYWYGR